uniref:(California timema) hypothetical protein n=1 Tax=Timema californicum TaxID=61474 RepID=A0A7R9J7H6_TIMCA|nr:unnamed protein product [Timema californicum]
MKHVLPNLFLSPQAVKYPPFLPFAPVGVLTYSRQYLSSSQLPDWTSSKKFLPQLHISSSGTIEKEGDGFLQVDFANKYAF